MAYSSCVCSFLYTRRVFHNGQILVDTTVILERKSDEVENAHTKTLLRIDDHSMHVSEFINQQIKRALEQYSEWKEQTEEKQKRK